MKKIVAPKPRNPFVQHLVKSKGSVHGKSYKAERRDLKATLRKFQDKSDT